MDMQNATAAGPSRGLLDVLFGSKPKEEDDADGKGFLPLMNLIKALNKNEEDGSTAENSRTEKDTNPGKSVIDYRAIGMPGWFAAVAEKQGEEKQSEGEAIGQAGALQSSLMMLQSQKAAEPVEKVDPNRVNQILKANSLPTLSASEMKLLQDVNAKFTEANRTSIGPVGMAAVGAMNAEVIMESAAAPPKGDLLDPQLAKELGTKGIDPRQSKILNAQVKGAAPEKMLHTDTYLQMHDSFSNKPQLKDFLQQRQFNLGDEASSVAQNQSAVANVAGSSEGGEAAGSDLFGKAKHGASGKVIDAENPKLDSSKAGHLFGASLIHASRSQDASGVRDVFLSGSSPEEMRNSLLGEVQNGIQSTALQGGGEMRLVIHPEDMGEVKLKVGVKGGKIEVQVTAENENVAKMIRSGSSDLESSLRDRELVLAKFDVQVSNDSPVASTDTRSNLSDQFLQQNSQNSFSQGTDNGRFSQWDGDRNQRHNPGFGQMANEQRGSGAEKSNRSSQKTPARDNSRRLDVVA